MCLVAKSCPTLCNPMDYSPPGSSVHGIFQARILEWVAISFSRGSSWPRDQTCVSCIVRQTLYLGSQVQSLQVCKVQPNKGQLRLKETRQTHFPVGKGSKILKTCFKTTTICFLAIKYLHSFHMQNSLISFLSLKSLIYFASSSQSKTRTSSSKSEPGAEKSTLLQGYRVSQASLKRMKQVQLFGRTR